MAAGRPTDYTPELAAEICAQLAAGVPLTRICAAESMPCERSVYIWLPLHPEFMQMYEKAREDQADTLADQMLEIADDSTRDYIETEAGKVYNSEHVQRSRLRVDTRKWIASKLKPRKYGDKTTNELTGPNGGPVQAEVIVKLVSANAA